jgi:hypothetical protein
MPQVRMLDLGSSRVTRADLALLPACFPHLVAFSAPLCTEIVVSSASNPCGYTYGAACAGFIRKWSDTLISLDLGSVPEITVDDVLSIVGGDGDGDGDHGHAEKRTAAATTVVGRPLDRLTRLRLPTALRVSREKIDERLERLGGCGGGDIDRRCAQIAVDWLARPQSREPLPYERQPVDWLTD